MILKIIAIFFLIKEISPPMQVCYPLIDTILDGLNPKEDLEDFCDLTNYTDVLCCTERSTFEVIKCMLKDSTNSTFMFCYFRAF